MATTKQKKAVDKIIENHGNVSKSMRQVGYSSNTAKKPTNLTDSKGYIELMAERGLTDELLLDALISDIKTKPKNRTRELELGFKLLNRLKESGSPMQVNIIQLILKKWGLDDVEQIDWDEGRISQDGV